MNRNTVRAILRAFAEMQPIYLFALSLLMRDGRIVFDIDDVAETISVVYLPK